MNEVAPDWVGLIQEQTTSGQTIDAFCAERGLKRHTFNKHKYARGVAKRGLAPVFHEVARPGLGRSLNIHLKNGRRIEVGKDFNASEVQRLVRVLESC